MAVERTKPTMELEKELNKQGFSKVAGVDEAGMGSLAGPLVSAAVVFPDDPQIEGLDDSKRLSFKKRERLYDIIHERASDIGIGIVSVRLITELNVYWAGRRAMIDAVREILPDPDYLLIDGNKPLKINIKQQSIVKGDSKCASIAAASIIAKVTRDRIMIQYDKKYPQYDFVHNKGYTSNKHKIALKKYGPSSIHRIKFKGVVV